MTVIKVRATAVLSLMILLPACGDPSEPGPVTMEAVAGSYVAAGLETTTGATTTDQLAAGASLRLNLNAPGTTSGRLFVPGGAEDGSDFEADLTGTWQLSGREVLLDHAADTFLRDMTLDYERPGVLSGSADFGGTRVTVELAKVVEAEQDRAFNGRAGASAGLWRY